MDIEKEINIFMNKLCAKLGICDPLRDFDYFIAKDYYEVNDFIREIFLAEGLNPDLELKLFRQAKRMFIEQFKSSEICQCKNKSK